MEANKPFPWNKDDLMKYKLISKDKTHVCDICKKTFKSKRILCYHTKIHTGEKPYECDICRKTFIWNGDLVNHRRTHTGEKPYKCDMCEKTFTQRSNLTTHKKIHTDEKVYSCEICQKSFSQVTGLSYHNQTSEHLKRIKSTEIDTLSNSNNFVDCGEIIKVETIKEEVSDDVSVNDPLS